MMQGRNQLLCAKFEQLKVNIPFISVRFWCGRVRASTKRPNFAALWELAGALYPSHTRDVALTRFTPPMPFRVCRLPEHPAFAATASARGKAKPEAHSKAEGTSKLGALPEWRLADLYEKPDAPKLESDLKEAEREANAMQDRYAGKLAKLLDGAKGGTALAEAVRAFEWLKDQMGW